MNKKSEPGVVLESEIIDLLKAGKEIEAIKKLQALRGIDLKEAEDIIDDYLEANADDNVNINIDNKIDKEKPYDSSVFGSKGEFKKNIIMVLGVLIIFIVYKQFTQ
jgi:hypothetical protein